MSSSLPTTFNNGTPVSSPQRQARSPRKTPNSERRPMKRRGRDNISEDIMRRNADLGQHGNMDGGEIDLPSNVATIFNVENVNTTTEFNEDELSSALEGINIATCFSPTD